MFCCSSAFSQELKEFADPKERTCDDHMFKSFGATTQDGVIVVYSAIQGLNFKILQGDTFLKDQIPDAKNNRYILVVLPTGGENRSYKLRIRANNYKYIDYDTGPISGGGKSSCCIEVNPKQSSALEKLARITVYDKDNKLLVGAVVKDKTTGKVYGSTRYDGTLAINFDNKGETTNVIVSHPSYSDTKEITVQAGVHDYKVYLRNYNPSKGSKPPRVRKLKPEKFTMELSAIGGSNLGVALDFTASYFLIGLGVDWMILAPEQTVTTPLDNSGYTGTFTKTTTMKLTGSRTNVFFDIGTYFKYFSLSCQVGLLCGTNINRASLYDGWGYGLVDDDLNEYWGTYEHRSFSNTTSDKETHLTITPQVKGYIPVGSKKTNSLSIGLGYTIIPILYYNPGLSGSLGIHFRF